VKNKKKKKKKKKKKMAEPQRETPHKQSTCSNPATDE